MIGAGWVALSALLLFALATVLRATVREYELRRAVVRRVRARGPRPYNRFAAEADAKAVASRHLEKNPEHDVLVQGSTVSCRTCRYEATALGSPLHTVISYQDGRRS